MKNNNIVNTIAKVSWQRGTDADRTVHIKCDEIIAYNCRSFVEDTKVNAECWKWSYLYVCIFAWREVFVSIFFYYFFFVLFYFFYLDSFIYYSYGSFENGKNERNLFCLSCKLICITGLCSIWEEKNYSVFYDTKYRFNTKRFIYTKPKMRQF